MCSLTWALPDGQQSHDSVLPEQKVNQCQRAVLQEAEAPEVRRSRSSSFPAAVQKQPDGRGLRSRRALLFSPASPLPPGAAG